MEESFPHWILKDIKAWVGQDCRFVFLSEVIKLVWVIPGSLLELAGSDAAALQVYPWRDPRVIEPRPFSWG